MSNMLNVALAIAAAAWSPSASFAARTDDGDPVPRTSIAADGTSFTVWGDRDRLVVSAGDRHGFSRPVRIAGKTYGYAAAAAPGGRAAVAYSAGDGVHVKLRGGRDRLVIRSREVTNSLALAADPRGGWVLAAQRRRHVLAATLESGGRPMAPPQDLGAGDFGADARPTQALAVTSEGTAQFAFNRHVERSLASFSVIATRPHAGRFGEPAAVSGEDVGEARVTASGARVVVAALRVTACGDAGCAGFPLAAALGSSLQGPKLARPNRAFAPTAAGNALVFQLKTRPEGFSRAAPVRAVAISHPDQLQTLTHTRAYEPIALPVADGGALALWTTSRSWGAALAGPDGRFTRTAAPLGPPPHPGHFNSTNREAAASGRYAIVAWGSGSNVRISMRQT
jgi:hypothetical protein